MKATVPVPVSKRDIVFSGIIHQIVQQDMRIGNTVKTFERAERAPGVRIIILSEDGENILLTQEFRTELNDWDIRLPGGKVFNTLEDFREASEKEMIENAKQAVQREAKEEVGIEVKKCSLYKRVKCGATIGWDLFYIVVDKYNNIGEQDLEMGENIRINWVPIEEAKRLCLEGNMSEGRSVATLLQYFHSQNL